jgi:hypothetical protein
MPALLDVAVRSDSDCDKEWEQHRGDYSALKAEPITVMRTKLLPTVRSFVNQTVYFPENKFWTYRATLEKDLLICEAAGEDDQQCMLQEMPEIAAAFGLSWCHHFQSECSFNVQPYGKMLEMDDDLRRSIIYQLTDKYNIYSLGRFATWRPLRADQLVKDVHKVERMIRQSEQRNRYERRLQC